MPVLPHFAVFQLKNRCFFGIIKWRIFTSAVNTKGTEMNTQTKGSGADCRRKLTPGEIRRTAWLPGLALALLLGVAGTSQLWQQERLAALRPERRTSRLSELEHKTKPHLKQAQDTVPKQEPETSPMEELNSAIESFRLRLRIAWDESTILARKVKDVQIAQKQKERDFIQAKRAIKRIRMVSGF